MNDESSDNTRTESLIEDAYNLYVGQVDPALIYRILIEQKISSIKAQSIMRWAKAKAQKLGWI